MSTLFVYCIDDVKILMKENLSNLNALITLKSMLHVALFIHSFIHLMSSKDRQHI